MRTGSKHALVCTLKYGCIYACQEYACVHIERVNAHMHLLCCRVYRTMETVYMQGKMCIYSMHVYALQRGCIHTIDTRRQYIKCTITAAC